MGLYENLMPRVAKRLPKRADDYVQWTAYSKTGKEAGAWKYRPCYSPIMGDLGGHEIHCIPFLSGKSRLAGRLHPLHYLHFMGLCQKEGLIPPEVKYFHNRVAGNCMIVPRLGWCRHTVYTVLSLYRHVDCTPGSMRIALEIKERTRLPWLQVLHYVMAKMNHSSGHVFINMDPGTYGNQGGRNPAAGMALRAFASMTPEEHKLLTPATDTCRMFADMANSINIQVPDPGKTDPYKRTSKVPKYLYPNIESILNPAYSPLYTDASLGAEDLARIMEKNKDGSNTP